MSLHYVLTLCTYIMYLHYWTIRDYEQ
jgi:hypothetical protein